ncbi:MAG: PAS domain S-box protein [Candidatus Omnitrophota bacterium]
MMIDFIKRFLSNSRGSSPIVLKEDCSRSLTDLEQDINPELVRHHMRAMHASMDGIAILDNKEKYSCMNNAHAKIYGYNDPKELVGKSWRVLYGPKELKHIESEIMPILFREKKWRGESVGKRKNGELFPQEISLTALEDGGLICIVRDISDRKNPEERLKKINECFLNFSDDPVENINKIAAVCGELLGATCVIYNRMEDGKLHSLGRWNVPDGYKIKDDSRGHICCDVIKGGQDEVMIIRDLLNSRYAQSDPNVQKYQLKTYLGKTVKFSNTCVGSLCAVYQKDLEPTELDIKTIGILASAIGVEEKRHSAQEDLRNSEERLRRITDNMVELITELDLEGNILYHSPSIESILGYRSKEMVGTNAFDFVHPEDLSRLKNEFKKALASESGWAIFRCRHAQGHYLWMEANGRVIKQKDGKTHGIVASWRDVTEKKEAEEKLKENEAQYKLLFESISAGVLHVAMDGRVLFANRSFLEMFERDRRDIINQSFLMFLHPDEKERILKIFQEAVRSEKVQARYHEVRCVTGSKKEFYANISNTPLIKAGKMIGFQTMIQDITERKLAENIVKENEAKLRQVIDLTPNFVFAKDIDGRFILVNQAVAEVYGTTVEEIVGKTDADFAKSKEEVEHFRKDDLDVIKSGKRKFIPEEVITSAQGEQRILQTTKIPFHIPGTNTPAILGVSTDITVLKKIQEAIARSEINYRSIFNSANDAIFIHDVKTGKILDVNQKTCEMYGYTSEEMRSIEVIDISSDRSSQNQKRALELIQKAAQGQPQLFEWFSKNKQGKSFWVEVNLKRARIGDEDRILAVVRDIDERKKVQEELEKYRKHLEELVEERTRGLRQSERLAATGRLAASIAHEINNPLQGITTHLEIIHDNFPKGFEKVKNYEFVKNNIEKIRNIVSKLLDIYRGEEEAKGKMDLHDVIDKVVMLVEHQLSRKGIKLTLNLDPNLPKVMGWQQQLHQVFLNMVLNAHDSIKKQKGEVTITTTHDEHHVIVQIKDTGEGIQEKDLVHIFDAFFTTKAESGTGLGLFVCQGIIKEHKGEIKVKSEVGKGSIFTITLPIT